MRENAGLAGFARLIAPVRPPQKADDPWASMAEYAARTRPDGLPADPWLLVSTALGVGCYVEPNVWIDHSVAPR